MVVAPSQTFAIEVGVTNRGGKIARHLEARCLPAGPFAFAPGSKRKYTRSSLHPHDSWGVQFLIRVKARTVAGAYPLFTTITAPGIKASDIVPTIKVEVPDSNKT